jgi:SET domain-containing protein
MSAKRHAAILKPEFASFMLIIRRSRIERLGVFAQETIPPGKRVIQYTGQRISKREFTRRVVEAIWTGKARPTYTVHRDRRSVIDGAVGGSGAEFINHSCDPNLTVRRIRGQIFLYSFRKIKAGEELTVNYAFRCACPCRCGSSKCRGTMCHF